MTTKVFATGVTGYVGGDALHTILQAHPDWQYSFLIRDPSRIGPHASVYNSIRIVTGDLSSLDLLRREAAAADIVLHFASSDDAPAVQAMLEGLGSDSKPRFYIHTSGTANLIYDDVVNGKMGHKGTKVYDDIEDIKTITSWPDAVLHRPVDKLVLGAGAKYANVKTAIVCPPAILGVGRGPGNKRTIQVPALIAESRKRGKVVQIGEGKSTWSYVHVHDLSDLFLRLTEVAAAGGEGADWGAEAYYFAESGELEAGAIAKSVAKALHRAGELRTEEVDVLSEQEAKHTHMMFWASMGMNSRSRASRARKVLGWKPKVVHFEESLEEVVLQDLEAEKTRLEEFDEGHAPGGAKELAENATHADIVEK